MPVPPTDLLDDFNRADDTSLGVNWVDNGSFKTLNQQCAVETVAGGTDTASAWNDSFPWTDMAVSVTLADALPAYNGGSPGAHAPRRGVTVRNQPASPCDENYQCALERDGDENATLVIYWGGPGGFGYDLVAGPTVVAEPTPNVSRLVASAVGTTISVWYSVDGTFGDVVLLAGSDSRHTSGAIGVTAEDVGTNDQVFDDFGGASIEGVAALDEILVRLQAVPRSAQF